MATVQFIRPDRMIKCLQVVYIFSDGQLLGSLSNNSTIQFELAPGRQDISLATKGNAGQFLPVDLRTIEIDEDTNDIQISIEAGVSGFSIDSIVLVD